MNTEVSKALDLLYEAVSTLEWERDENVGELYDTLNDAIDDLEDVIYHLRLTFGDEE